MFRLFFVTALLPDEPLMDCLRFQSVSISWHQSLLVPWNSCRAQRDCKGGDASAAPGGNHASGMIVDRFGE